MHANPLVSVIIPVYNGEAFLRETLESVLAQTYHPLEIIVVDDGSTDGSVSLLHPYGDRITLLQQANKGVAAARNAGIKHASGDYIALIDQDDIWEPQKTAQQAAYLDAHPGCGYVLSRQTYFLQPGTMCPPWLKPTLLHGDYTGYIVGTMLARRAVFEQVGLFDTHYPGGDDTAWFFSAKDMQIPLRHLPQVVLRKRVHGDNVSGNVRSMHAQALRIVRDSMARQRKESV